eukprot:scaffold159935_cov32-Tisochrysis_lutea.AAC.1
MRRPSISGAKLHRTCSCLVRMTEPPNSRPYKTGERMHKGCPNLTLTHPLVKALQVGVGAALRGTAGVASDTGQSVADAGIASVEECLLHCFNVHEGKGPFTGKDVACRYHPRPYQSSCRTSTAPTCNKSW